MYATFQRSHDTMTRKNPHKTFKRHTKDQSSKRMSESEYLSVYLFENMLYAFRSNILYRPEWAQMPQIDIVFDVMNVFFIGKKKWSR